MAREADVFSFVAGPITIKAGGGSAMCMLATQGQVGWQFKYVSGGSLEIHGATLGVSAGSALPSGSSGYLMGTQEVEYIAGPAKFFLVSTGTDTVCHVLRPLSSGF